MTVPVALSLLITTFADERQRAWVLGLNGSLLSGGFTVGAIVGGMLVGVLSWRWAFLINIPFALAILVPTPIVVPAGRSPDSVRLDVPGAISVTFGLFASVFAITERYLAALTIFSMEAGLVFLTTLYIQDVLHFGPLTTGLIFGVPGLASVVAGIVAGRIIARRGARIVLLAALLVQGGMTAPLILLGADSAWLWLLIPALFGGFFGHITAVVAATVTATSEVPDAHKGLVTGLIATSQRVAVTIGIPVLGAVMVLRGDLLAGIRLALAADVLLTITAVILIYSGLYRRVFTGTPTH
jgi:MFS family permease